MIMKTDTLITPPKVQRMLGRCSGQLSLNATRVFRQIGRNSFDQVGSSAEDAFEFKLIGDLDEVDFTLAVFAMSWEL